MSLDTEESSAYPLSDAYFSQAEWDELERLFGPVDEAMKALAGKYGLKFERSQRYPKRSLRKQHLLRSSELSLFVRPRKRKDEPLRPSFELGVGSVKRLGPLALGPTRYFKLEEFGPAEIADAGRLSSLLESAIRKELLAV